MVPVSQESGRTAVSLATQFQNPKQLSCCQLSMCIVRLQGWWPPAGILWRSAVGFAVALITNEYGDRSTRRLTTLNGRRERSGCYATGPLAQSAIRETTQKRERRLRNCRTRNTRFATYRGCATSRDCSSVQRNQPLSHGVSNQV